MLKHRKIKIVKVLLASDHAGFKLKEKINPILNFIPNIALDDVPVGKDEKSNKELKIEGNIPKFSFKVKSHYEIGTRLNLMNFDIATKTSGSRFVFLKGKLAELERAISNFMLDIHTKEFGYQEISPPLIATCLLYTSDAADEG